MNNNYNIIIDNAYRTPLHSLNLQKIYIINVSFIFRDQHLMTTEFLKGLNKYWYPRGHFIFSQKVKEKERAATAVQQTCVPLWQKNPT